MKIMYLIPLFFVILKERATIYFNLIKLNSKIKGKSLQQQTYPTIV